MNLYKPTSKFAALRTFLSCMCATLLILATEPSNAIAQNSPFEADKSEVIANSLPDDEGNDNDEIARLKRGLHGMTLTFIRFAQEQEMDAYETGRWTGTFLTRQTDENFSPREFLAWMKNELAMHEVRFEVLEETPDLIKARRGNLLTRDKLPWFYRYGITQSEYEDFYHGALVEIAKAYGVRYTQKKKGELILLTLSK